jgi:peptidoglycan hydrolase-like protein with peptidoglycan-binding domain
VESERRAAWTLAGLLGVPLVITLALASVALARSPLASAAGAAPLIGSVAPAERSDVTSTSVTVVQPVEFPVTSQASGVVTALHVTVGAALTEGAVAMEVSGAPVIAYVSSSPLYRDISRGLRGPDVATAQTLLVALGYLDRADGDAGSATASAVARFNSDHGHNGDGTVLRTSSLLWIPDDGSAPTSVSVRVGAMVAPGTELFRAVAGHASITVTAASRDVDRVLSVNGASVDLPAGASKVIAPDDVAAVIAALADKTTGQGTLALAKPRNVGTLPAAAVITDQTGKACFFPDATGAGQIIDTSSGMVGEVDVDPALIGTSVLLNPREVRRDLSCGS